MSYRELLDVIPGTCISMTYAHDFSQKVLIDLCSSLFLYISIQSPYQNSSYWENSQISPSFPIQVILQILSNQGSVKTEWGTQIHAHPAVPCRPPFKYQGGQMENLTSIPPGSEEAASAFLYLLEHYT